MAYSDRLTLFERIQKLRESNVILYATSDRPHMEGQINNDAFDYFVRHLDRLWRNGTQKISLILHTSGGDTSAAWRIVNLLRIFCDELEVIIPTKAHSAGTLISLGTDKIIMTKQATLGPIDPSLHGPLSPEVPNQPHQRVAVSVEAVQGYLDIALNELAIRDDDSKAQVLTELSAKVHPLVLGQIYRTRNQIRDLAGNLLDHQKVAPDIKERVIEFLCSDSGSHDRTINRREARELGLKIENASPELYELLSALYEDITDEMEMRTSFSPDILCRNCKNQDAILQNPEVQFACPRVLIESTEGGSSRRVTEGIIKKCTYTHQPNREMPPQEIPSYDVQLDFEGWKEI
ncbi:SDH family Clp fold serine proteinase [Flexibacterium corallicola]|uniref:SDH family Clp fold serine proteinase n=1 Tax=Flexibacterium corallicola TaxID=3037259 RepID=UPI00286EE8F9|nr:hypothetical protein [Pseudovibrio sp. M1P-2-3]